MNSQLPTVNSQLIKVCLGNLLIFISQYMLFPMLPVVMGEKLDISIAITGGMFPFSGHKNSFFGDLHCLGKDGYRFYTETKVVTTRWFDETEKKAGKVSTWDGTI